MTISQTIAKKQEDTIRNAEDIVQKHSLQKRTKRSREPRDSRDCSRVREKSQKSRRGSIEIDKPSPAQVYGTVKPVKKVLIDTMYSAHSRSKTHYGNSMQTPKLNQDSIEATKT
jgi:hypothetical protein